MAVLKRNVCTRMMPDVACFSALTDLSPNSRARSTLGLEIQMCSKLVKNYLKQKDPFTKTSLNYKAEIN